MTTNSDYLILTALIDSDYESTSVAPVLVSLTSVTREGCSGCHGTLTVSVLKFNSLAIVAVACPNSEAPG